MMSLFMRMFIKNNEDVSNPSVKKAYATLSSVVGILLNLFLCTAKIVIGLLSRSVAISADGFNNLSDAGTNLVSLLGFKIARYGGGSTHPFGHGRIEWIMGIFVSIAVLLMGIKLAGTSVDAIANPQEPMFNTAVVIVLVLSVLVKIYMYYYNRQFAKITDSETLKATAADCISDSIATIAVLASAIVSHLTVFEIDGYCGVLVSVFIMFAGVKSLWEVLGRIMGKAADADTKDIILKMVKSHSEIIAVHNLMLHDYGFGYFVVSMRVEGCRKDSEQLYIGINQISYELFQKFHCDCFIQIDYLLEDKELTNNITEQIYSVMKKYSDAIRIDNFRLIENGSYINVAFDMVYPAELQKREEEIYKDIRDRLELKNPKYRIIIKGIIRRERFSLHR
ncbi:cation diffusion facilitator family transporter [Lachnospiraceae bacterium 48-42]|jgi:cation diffusion facilitator family transporter|uniref:cation diffusion facilitator family transporter n=1 Tax=Sporofaciens sp. JLR.KK001 TaxID=3112621 RepID=UPI0021472E71|nr:cation diffusion facilitator family transporter [[Clostridium] innocuum]MCR0559605.1 cation diffusion facilitator family transporter [[Clostridium] innocuum]